MNAHVRSLWICSMVLATGAMPAPAWAEDPYGLAWISQIGTSGNDSGVAVAVDSVGNAYTTGRTNGSLGGPNAGSGDAVLSKFDGAGNHLWSQQIGTSLNDESFSVAIDSLGNAYISGYTQGSLGGSNAGGYDAFLSKFDTNGNLVWSQQIGTSSGDGSYGVAVDSLNNVFITGYTSGGLGGANAGDEDVFLSKFDATGNHIWSQQIGGSGIDYGFSVATDGLGNAYVSGYTDGSLVGPALGGGDAFLVKFDGDGNQLWATQIGTSSSDVSRSVAVDASGNAYISGWTSGDLGGPHAGGFTDAFLSKLDADGNHLWSQQIGTDSFDYSYSVTVDVLGNPYISGYTQGSLVGVNAGDADAFLSKFDTDGNYLWSQQIGTIGSDSSRSVTADSLGNVWISGNTAGSLGGPNAGGNDTFVAKFSATAPIPLPAALWAGFALLGSVGGLKWLRRRA